MATFTGFDAINRTEPLIDQMPISCIGIENATVIDGRGGGNAIRLTDGAYMYTAAIDSADENEGHYVACGAAFKINGPDSPFDLIIMGIEISRILTPNNPMPEFALTLQKNWLMAKTRGSATPIRQVIKNEWFYVELRFEIPKYSASTPMTSSIHIDGQVVASAKVQHTGVSGYACVFAAQSNSDATIDIDDFYFERKYNNASSTIPILASGKISCLPLTATRSNEFTVAGSNAHSALSDNDDATYISSDVAASAVFDVSNNVSQVYGLNVNVRGKTANNGVASITVEQNGNALTSEFSVGLKSNLTTTTISDLSKNDGTKIWTESIKNGIQIKVTT